MAYELEKAVWTDDDFSLMGWHDATVYAAATLPESFELVLDIDYILKWVDPVQREPRSRPHLIRPFVLPMLFQTKHSQTSRRPTRAHR